MDYLLGQISLFPFNFAPLNWMLCNGATLAIAQNSALYSLLGTQFGGNGTSTFCLPNLTNASPQPGASYYICIAGVYPSRS